MSVLPLGIAARRRERPCTQPFTRREATGDPPRKVGRTRGVQGHRARLCVRDHRGALALECLTSDDGRRRESSIIKTLTHLLPSDWASKAESAFRIFGADRALLLVEGIGIAKLIMLAVAYPFRRGR